MNRAPASIGEREALRSGPRRRLLGAWGAVLVGLLLVASGCGRQNRVWPAGASGELPDQEVSDFALTETEQGTPSWKLYARYAATYSARNLVVARSIRVDFFDEKGQKSSELTAREGEIQQQSRDMTARGNVVLQTTEGTRMSTEELRFYNKQQKIVSPPTQQVRVERAGDVLTGYGFESDPNLKHFEFKSNVKAVVRTQSGGGILEHKGGSR
ncbi:MAG TPA: LPS export ABC transporter periplasmic protein LptC [Candidatus Eisenbacteria bacterium]